MIVAEIFVNLVLQLFMQGILLGLGGCITPPPPSPPAIRAPAETGMKSPVPLKKAEPLLAPAEKSPEKELAQSP